MHLQSYCIYIINLRPFSPFSKLQEGEKGFVTTSDVGGVGGGGVVGGGGGELGSPDSLPELERPPLRKIDMYIRPDCPCCNMTKRYTVAFLASIGNFNFLLSLMTSIRKKKADKKRELIRIRRRRSAGGIWAFITIV